MTRQKISAKRSPRKTKTPRASSPLKPSRLPKTVKVPDPRLEKYTSDLPRNQKSVRSIVARERQAVLSTQRKAEEFLKRAPVFKTDLDLDRELGQDQPAQVFSGQWVDKNGIKIAFYLAERWADAPLHGEPKPLDAQYQGRTQVYLEKGLIAGKSLISDGLKKHEITRCHESTQTLCSILQPVCPTSDMRHQYSIDSNHDPRVMQYEDENTKKVCEERTGVHHLVSGWIQQGQAAKGLYLSNEWTRSGVGLGAIQNYYKSTNLMAKRLSAMFQVMMPECYQEYREAFDAGVWTDSDPGPWLGRAIVYKLQVSLHKDKEDGGPAASFPVGFFSGGEMLIPQLKAKLSYKPGHICLFFTSKIYHAVSKWTPTIKEQDDTLTPGRIGHVFFFPKESLQQLKGKKKGWAKNTNYGREPDASC